MIGRAAHRPKRSPPVFSVHAADSRAIARTSDSQVVSTGASRPPASGRTASVDACSRFLALGRIRISITHVSNLLAKTTKGSAACRLTPRRDWLRGLDLNQRPLGYEPNELPGCSTPR